MPKTRINNENYSQIPKVLSDDIILKDAPQTAGAPAGYGSVSEALSIITQSSTGWASYVDTQYTVGSPFSLSAGVNTNLPNNAGTIINSQIPSDIASFYTAGKITGRNGDGLAMQLFFFATPTTPNQYIDIWIDIGGAIGQLYRQTFSFPRGAGITRGIMYTLPAAYTLATWQANGGTVRVLSDAICTIYGITYNFARTHKAN